MAMNKDFGAFELKEKIGAGGMASVYLAVQKALQRPVVLKILYPHLAEDEKLVQRFEREARAAAMMRHENIIQVIDMGRHDDVAYIAMEFVEGMDLKKWLEAHGAPPVEMALLMMRDVCRGLEHAHGHRIVHRDIKPANVMLTPDGTIKIMDFGLARSGSETSTQMTMVGSVLGTPAYMSPEQATGEAVDERSDIFSAGVLAYELLGGKRPFAGDSYSTVLRSILTVEPPELSEFNPLVSDEVARIVRGMLQKDVSKRYQTISQVREAFEDVIEQSGLHRGKDLLREYAMDPEGVSAKWRQKRLSRHMDQGLYYENMGLGKIDDALLEFRRVLFLDPSNAVARDHVKKLEREREILLAKSPPAPAAPPAGDDRTMVLSSEEAARAVAAGAPPAAAPRPAGAEARDDKTMVISSGQAAALGAGAGASVSGARESAKREAPRPAPRPARPASKQGGPPVPALIGAGVVVLAIAGWLLFGRGHGGRATGEVPPPETTSATTPQPPAASEPPVQAPPVAAAPDTAKLSPLEQARAAFAGGRWADAAGLAKDALASHGLARRDQHAARELIARSLADDKQANEAAAAFGELLKSYPAYKPDLAGFSPDEQAAYQTAKLNAQQNAAAMPPATPPTPPAGAANATIVVKVAPFAESFALDGRILDQNKKQFTATVPPGHHTVTVKHPVLGSKDWAIDLSAGETRTLTQDFASATGSISVTTADATWGEIYMDGDPQHHATPWVIDGVLPGKHEIALVRDGYTVDGGAQTAEVKAGQTVNVKFRLKKKK